MTRTVLFIGMYFCTMHFNTTFPQTKKPDIKWSFTKFIIDREGNVAARFEPTADMAAMEACVKSLLGKKTTL